MSILYKSTIISTKYLGIHRIGWSTFWWKVNEKSKTYLLKPKRTVQIVGFWTGGNHPRDSEISCDTTLYLLSPSGIKLNWFCHPFGYRKLLYMKNARNTFWWKVNGKSKNILVETEADCANSDTLDRWKHTFGISKFLVIQRYIYFFPLVLSCIYYIIRFATGNYFIMKNSQHEYSWNNSLL